MTDLEAIHDFLTTIRWGDKTQILPLPDEKGYFLLVPPHSVLVPCSWESPARAEAIAVAKENNTLPGLILWGEPSESEFDLITEQLSREGFIIKWVGLENRIRHGIFMVKNLDSLAFWKW